MTTDAAVSAESLYYRPSRQFTMTGSLLMLVEGGVASLPLGVAYAYLVLYNPLIYVNFIATVCFGVGMGLAARIGIRVGKVRWPLVAFVNGLLVGLFGLYVSWVVWLHALAARSGAGAIWPFDPEALWALMRDVAQVGAWSIKGTTPTGAVLYVFWAVEAAIIVGGSAFVCGASSNAPFCEACERWAEPVEDLHLGAAPTGDHLRAALEAGRIESLAELGPAGEGARTDVSVSVCPACGELGFLSVNRVTIDVKRTVDVKRESRGRDSTEEKKQSIVRNLVLHSAQIERVRGLVAPDSCLSRKPHPRP